MKAYVGAGIMVAALLSACSRTVMVPVAPRMDLKGYATVGIVDFNSNSERAIRERSAAGMK